MTTKPKRGPGRPPKSGAPLKRTSIAIGPDTDAILIAYGDGNRAEGIRRAAKLIQAEQQKRVLACPVCKSERVVGKMIGSSDGPTRIALTCENCCAVLPTTTVDTERAQQWFHAE